MKLILKDIRFPFFLLIVTAMFIDACGVDYSLDQHKYARIYMPQARNNPAKRSVLIIDSTQTVKYGAAYGGPSRPHQGIPVHFSVNSSLVDSFNAQHVTSYSILPEDSYTLSKKMAVIPADSLSTGPLKVQINPEDNIKAGQKFLLPITMKVTRNKIKTNDKLKTTYFVISGSYRSIEKSNWKILDYDNIQPNSQEGLAKHLIDGDPNTYWLTEFAPDRPPPPHYVSIDMGESRHIHGLSIIARLDQKIGNPKDITVQFSNDGKTWRDGESFTLPFDNTVTHAKVYFSQTIQARYFKFIVNSTFQGLKFTHVVEVSAF